VSHTVRLSSFTRLARQRVHSLRENGVQMRVSLRALLKNVVNQVFLLEDEASDSDDDDIVTKNQIDSKYSAKVDVW
jgi:hypothetical protein